MGSLHPHLPQALCGQLQLSRALQDPIYTPMTLEPGKIPGIQLP
jgi:hypothetical protein